VVKVGFMSSVCPDLDMRGLARKAAEYRYPGIELRVEWNHGHGVELGISPEKQEEVKEICKDSDITLSCLSTSVKIGELAEERDIQMNTLRKYIELSSAMGIKNIRIFGDPVPEEYTEEFLDREVDFLSEVLPSAEQAGVNLCLETHCNMLPEYARYIYDQVDSKAALAILWHPGHHLQREVSIEQAYNSLKGIVKHVHFNITGSVGTPEDRKQAFTLLREDEFAGFVSVEVINPDNSEEILKKHAQFYSEFSKGEN